MSITYVVHSHGNFYYIRANEKILYVHHNELPYKNFLVGEAPANSKYKFIIEPTLKTFNKIAHQKFEKKIYE